MAAAAANFPMVFKIPDASATKDIKTKYGRVILVNNTAKSNFSGEPTKPGTKTIRAQGIIISITITKRSNTHSNNEKACSANTLAAK